MRKHSLTPDSLKNLSCAILLTAVEDWQSLEYGHQRFGAIIKEVAVDRDDVLEFFFSEDFDHLVEVSTNYTPKQIRRALKIPQEAYEQAKMDFDCY